MRRAAPFLTVLALAGAAHAQAPTQAPAQSPAKPAPAAPGNTVSPVTVFPKTDAPKVVKTYPAAGQALSAGVLVMTITFDQPMKPTGFDFSPAAGGEPAPCLKTPRLLSDTKTFVLLCTTAPGKTYALSFNAQPQGAPGGGFENVAEHRAEPATLSFKTTDGEGPIDIRSAMKAAGLRENLDMPIEVSPDRKGDVPDTPKS